MKHPFFGSLGGALLGMCILINAPAQESTSKAVSNINQSPIIDEVANMAKAGVSPEVLKSYIENWTKPYHLSAKDIITLKDRAVPDELTTALLKRAAALNTPPSPSASQVRTRGNTSRYLDPEGYDYFQYYYLYPRSLAAANQRFYSSSSTSYGFWPYAYGYAPPVFYPYPPAGSPRR